MTTVLMLSCSIHGLVRGDNMELGRDSDTGGQVFLYLNNQNFVLWL